MATAAAVLAFGQPSRGIEVPTPGSHAALASPPASSFPAAVGHTVRGSLNNDGSQNSSGGNQPDISGDGRWQVFVSRGSLDPAVTNNSEAAVVYVRDLKLRTTTRLSNGRKTLPAAASTVAVEADAVTEPDGDSTRPSISADGRYVSFVTTAHNIVPVGADPAVQARTLVVCDRDPGFNSSTGLQLDRPDPATGFLANTCEAVYSSGTAVAASIDDTQRPRLSSNGNRVVWTESGAGAVRWLDVSDSSGLAPAPDLVGGNFVNGNSVDTGSTTFSQYDPVLDEFGSNVYLGLTRSSGSAEVVRVNISATTVTRLDVDPDNPTAYLGDEGGSTEAVSFSSISVSRSQDVLFRLIVSSTLGFVGPRSAALALPTPGSGVYFVTQPFNQLPKTTLVSLNNAGTAVPAFDAAMSGDGRFIAFSTDAVDVHDGKEAAGATEIVARDLTLDAAQGTNRIKGALVTATATPSCNPTAPAVNCASAAGTISDITMDESGSRIGWADSATDLVPGDTNAATDTFVRSWQPTLAASPVGTTDFGDLQTGDNKVLMISLTVSGFGPVFISGTQTDSPDFVPVGDTCVDSSFPLHNGDVCSVSVRFEPDTVGSKTGTLSLTSDQYPSPQVVDNLIGNAVTNGPRNAAADTTRASVNTTGGQAKDGGDESMISGNGRWDVFVSQSDLTGREAPDPPSPAPPLSRVQKVFVRDLADPQKTVQISLDSTLGATAGDPSRPRATAGHPTAASPNKDSYSPSISSDGRFVSFITRADDIVPPRVVGDHGTNFVPDYTIVVCDRDPSGKKDKAGNPILDLPRGTTQVPDNACYPIESGAVNDGGIDADSSVLPRLSGDGTKITWVETEDGDNTLRRVQVATLSAAGGTLGAPKNIIYVPSQIAGFEHGTDRTDESFIEQTEPVLTEKGGSVVYWARQNNSGAQGVALIETTLPATGSPTEIRLDTTTNGDTYLGDNGSPNFILDPPAVSDDGKRVAFAFRLPPPTPSDVTKTLVYVVTQTGNVLDTVLESRNNLDRKSAGFTPALSGDGRYLAFQAAEPNMHNGIDSSGDCFADSVDSHVSCQIVARDLVRDQQRSDAGLARLPNELASTSIATTCTKSVPPGRLCGANSDSSNPTIDATGSEIGFDSGASDIVPGDDNMVPQSEGPDIPAPDAFVHTWRPTLVVPTLDFGAVAVGAHKDKTFSVTVQDFGATPQDFGPISLGVSSITGLNPADFKIVSTTCTGKTLHQGAPAGQPLVAAPESCTFTIRFAPTLPGNRKATLQTAVGKNGYPRHSPDGTISYDPIIVRDLTGIGATPIAVVNPAALDFGERLPDAPKVTKTVTVTNTGSAPLIITAVIVDDTTNPGAKIDYTVDATNCLATTPVGGTCVITVSFVGHRVGIRDAVLVVIDNTPTGTTSVGLKGRVGKPTITANPGVSPVGRVITVSGTGFAPSQDVDLGFETDVQVTGKTRADGTFDIQMVVLGNGPQGPRTLHGHSTGLDNSIAADTPFLTVLGSIDNTLNGIRH